MPRKMKEMRKIAASKMATNLTQKPILSRFIIMADYLPRYSGTKTIVYHFAPDDRGHDRPAGRGVDDLQLGICFPGRNLDQGEICPFAHLDRSRLGLDAERACPAERRQFKAGRTIQAVQSYREERLFEEVHARAAPEPVSSHTYPDAAFDHPRHGRDAAPEEIIRARAMRRRDTGLRKHVHVLLSDPRRQVRGYR